MNSLNQNTSFQTQLGQRTDFSGSVGRLTTRQTLLLLNALAVKSMMMMVVMVMIKMVMVMMTVMMTMMVMMVMMVMTLLWLNALSVESTQPQ